jgi:Chlorite dismutase
MQTNPRLFSFIGGNQGPWKARESRCITGEPLPRIERLEITSGISPRLDATWVLQGAMSNERYVTRPEKAQLVEKQQGLGRPEATYAVLIPIKKSPDWWALTQDERCAIFELQSHHNQIGMDYLPAIARRLHHCRDLTEEQPFDFLTWFEFAPSAEEGFDQLLARLRASVEWGYVEREVEIRLLRE